MRTFNYEAQDCDGVRVRGVMSANTPADVAKKLRGSGLLPIDIRSVDGPRLPVGSPSTRAGLRLVHLVIVLLVTGLLAAALATRESWSDLPGRLHQLLRGTEKRPVTVDEANAPARVAATPTATRHETVLVPPGKPVIAEAPPVDSLEDAVPVPRHVPVAGRGLTADGEVLPSPPQPIADTDAQAARRKQEEQLHDLIDEAMDVVRRLDHECRVLGRPIQFPLITAREFGEPRPEKGEYSRDQYNTIMQQRATQDSERRKRLAETRERLAEARAKVRELKRQYVGLD